MNNQDNPQQHMFETIRCPLCQSDQFEVIAPAQYPADLKEPEQLLKLYSASSDAMLMDQLVRCKDCELVYLNPRPSAAIILESYKSAEDPEFVRHNPERIATFKRYLAWLIKHCQWPVDGTIKVLDVGCAGAAFPKAAADSGLDATGVEPSAWLANYGRETYGLPIHTGTLEEQSFPDQTFDCVTLWDVIEHLVDGDTTLAEIHRILKPGGVFIVNFPNNDSIMRKILGLKWPFYLSVHLLYFTPKTVRRYLNKNDFDVELVRPYFQTLSLGYVLKRASAYFSIFGAVAKLVSILGLGGIPIRYNMGQSLLVARKPKAGGA